MRPGAIVEVSTAGKSDGELSPLPVVSMSMFRHRMFSKKEDQMSPFEEAAAATTTIQEHLSSTLERH